MNSMPFFLFLFTRHLGLDVDPDLSEHGSATLEPWIVVDPDPKGLFLFFLSDQKFDKKGLHIRLNLQHSSEHRL
jgi:hypothetical protein